MFLLPERDAYLSETETADLLGFSVAKLRDLRRRQRIGAAMIGRHVLHSGKHIRDFLRSCEQTGQRAVAITGWALIEFLEALEAGTVRVRGERLADGLPAKAPNTEALIARNEKRSPLRLVG